jgi:glycosyltransferase involved in cell wall biosynthesis
MPEISVIIPVFNKEKYIANTIQSVLNQTFKDFELIIIDDGSTDHSIEIIKGFSDPRIHIYQQENRGVSLARNFGASQSQSGLLAFLDADDIWYDNHLSEINQMYHHFPEAVYFATGYQIKYNEKLTKDYSFHFEKNPVLLYKHYQYDNGKALFFTSNFCVKKGIFEFEGGFNPHIHAEDTDLFLRLGLHYPLAYSQNITMLHINEADNSLFANYQTDKKVKLLENFIEAEKNDKKLKAFLDLNRFVWVIEYRLSGQTTKANKLLKQIELKNLNQKQKFLLSLPVFMLKRLKKIHKILLQSGLHWSRF